MSARGLGEERDERSGESLRLLDRGEMGGVEHHRSRARHGRGDPVAMFRGRCRDVLCPVDHEERRRETRQLVLQRHPRDGHAAGRIALRVRRQQRRARGAEKGRLPVPKALREETAEHGVGNRPHAFLAHDGRAFAHEVARHLGRGVGADDAVDAARMLDRKLDCRHAAHREAANMSASGPGRVEHRERVLGQHRDRIVASGRVGGSVTARVHAQHAEVPQQERRDGIPHGVVGAERIEEKKRRIFFIAVGAPIKTRLVAHHESHRSSPSHMIPKSGRASRARSCAT